MKHIISLFIASLLCLSARADISFLWTSEVLVPGESVTLYVVQKNGSSFTPNAPLTVRNGSIQLKTQGSINSSNSPTGRMFVAVYECIPDKTGVMELLPFSVKNSDGSTEKTEVQSIPILPFDKIKWHTVTYYGNTDSYGILWYPSRNVAYLNEQIRCTLKLYTKNTLSNLDYPKLESDGLAMTTFTPPLHSLFITQETPPSGTALLTGERWNVFSFSSILTPIKQGIVTAGPGSADSLALVEQINPQYGQLIRHQTIVPLPITKLLLNARPLPSGAPAGFTNAVGDFQLSTETPATDITEGEPVSVTIKVKGQGNLNIIDCPLPEGEENWKLYPANKLTSNAQDQVEFQLLMKPLKEVSGIPSFKLVFFNPSTESYEIAKSPSIPLKWKSIESSPAAIVSQATPPPAGTIPVEEMTDILYTDSSPKNFTLSLSAILANAVLWPWTLIPALVIFGLGITLRIKHSQNRSSHKTEKIRQLSQIRPEDDTLSFLKSLGAFIEGNIPENQRTPDVRQILQERDNSAFLPDPSSVNLSQDTRKKMYKSVQNIVRNLPLLIIALVASFSLASAETPAEAFLKGDYKNASELIAKETPPADCLDKANFYYLRGNIDYKNGRSGEAALNYHRALHITPDHYEARRNLAFIERKEGSLTHSLSGLEEALSVIPFIYYRLLFLLSLGVFLTIFAYMWAFKERSPIHWITVSLSLLLLSGSAWALIFYPDNYNPLMNKNIFIITRPDASGWHAATKNSNKVLSKIPPGSVSKVLQESGSWFYVEFATGSRAWIQRDSGDYIVPQ